jgi:hypothetical protein
MAESGKAQAIGGLTRGKAILIAVLAVVLLVVLYVQFGRGGGHTSSNPVGYIPRRPLVVPPASSESTAATAANAGAALAKKVESENKLSTTNVVVDETRWKSPNLADVTDYDPFALPATFPKAESAEAAAGGGNEVAAIAAAEDAKRLADAIEQLQRELDELEQMGVQVVVRERDQYVAMVGDRTLHVGDEIRGFIVTEIDPKLGVRVERKGTQ